MTLLSEKLSMRDDNFALLRRSNCLIKFLPWISYNLLQCNNQEDNIYLAPVTSKLSSLCCVFLRLLMYSVMMLHSLSGPAWAWGLSTEKFRISRHTLKNLENAALTEDVKCLNLYLLFQIVCLLYSMFLFFFLVNGIQNLKIWSWIESFGLHDL